MPPKKGKTPALHVKCDPIPVGTVITDTKKLEITVQKEFAQGGFGRICDAKVKGNTAKYIVKFEPTDNGPLFNENHLYPRILTQTALQKYTSEHKLKFLGLPHCVSSGVYKDVRYLVMPKYDYTLEQLIKEKKGVLPLGNTISVVLSVLDSLEYIHSCDYAHGDIKAGNLMLMSKTDFTKVYLIDYGLAKKISKPVEKDDPKKAHNGTALFNSMDAHRGCGPSFRGDIEILAHNVLLWLTGKLPWKDLEDNPNAVQSAKADLLSNIPKNVKALVPDQKAAALLITLYDAAKKLKIEQKPNFAAIKKAIGSPEAASKRKRGAAESEEEVEKPTPRSRARKEESEAEEEEEEKKPKPRGRPRVKKEEAPTEPEEEAEEPKPSKSRPRKAGAAIAAAKKSKVIYPGLNKKSSTEKSDDDEESAEEAPPPVPKKSKPPTTKPSTVRSRRPPASDSPAASSSEGNVHHLPSSIRALCNTTPPPRVFPLDGAASPERPKKKEPLSYRPVTSDSDYDFDDDSYFPHTSAPTPQPIASRSPALVIGTESSQFRPISPPVLSPSIREAFIRSLASTGLRSSPSVNRSNPVCSSDSPRKALVSTDRELSFVSNADSDDLPLEKILRKRAHRAAESPISLRRPPSPIPPSISPPKRTRPLRSPVSKASVTSPKRFEPRTVSPKRVYSKPSTSVTSPRRTRPPPSTSPRRPRRQSPVTVVSPRRTRHQSPVTSPRRRPRPHSPISVPSPQPTRPSPSIHRSSRRVMPSGSGFHYQERHVRDVPLVSEVVRERRPIDPPQPGCNVM